MDYKLISNKPEILWFNSMIGDRIDCDYYAIDQLEFISKINKIKHKKLNELIKVKRSEPQTDSKDFTLEGIDVIRMSDIDEFSVNFDNTIKIPSNIYENLKEFTLKSNMVIFGLTGVTLGKAVPISENIKRCITNRRIAQLEIKEGYDSFYVAVFINTKYGRNQLFRYSTGVAQPNLRLEDTGEILIPTPSIQIQKYIGDKVRKAEELREEAKRLKKDAEEVLNNELNSNKADRFNTKKEYIFINNKPNILYVSEGLIDNTRIEAMFYKKEDLQIDSKLGEYKYGYKLLRDLCMKITDGTHKTPNYKENGVTFISSKNILEDEIDFENVKYISEEEHKDISKRCNVECGDILFTKIGRIGYAKVVPNRLDTFSIFVSVALLKLKKEVDEYYLEVFLNSEYGKNQSKRLCKGANQPDFHLEDIGELKIPILPIEMQKEIGNKMRKVEELKYNIRNLIQQSKQDIEDLIEGNFDISKIKESN